MHLIIVFQYMCDNILMTQCPTTKRGLNHAPKRFLPPEVTQEYLKPLPNSR